MTEPKAKRRKFLTLADIEKVVDRPITEVEVPELGGWLRIRPVSSRTWERIQNQARMLDGELDELVVKPAMFAEAIVDANGEPVFTLEEAEKILDKSVIAVERLSALIVGATLSSLKEEAEEEAELRKDASAAFRPGDDGSGGDGG